ncbi:STN domain-containing protein [Methylosinus sp. Sm6]|uniref:STN domain-containing protein n=1 Tax=Methylosinus sp. Sm6 TaxID=2866948 RepID=UPI001C99D11A|nr:STN domain-containing protein [Methylosinus sp. Sm6]MBY6242343.1 STN domain-containing protein [Methylosinus sp. Sm6]
MITVSVGMVPRVVAIVGFVGAGSWTAAEELPARFDIPAEALSDALYAYSAATGIEVLVRSDMVERRQSARVAGTYVPTDALRALLSGTGLSARAIGANAVTLASANAVAPPPTVFVAPLYPDYSSALQAAVTSALCRMRETRPGDYRLAARLWVGRSGAVTQVALLGTTGDGGRDALLTAALRRVEVGEAPPADLIQPTTMLILPRRRETAECAGRATP